MDPGIVPRAVKYIWSEIAVEQQRGAAASPPATITFDAKCSFFEIYQEKVFDLLDSSPASSNGNLQVGAKNSSMLLLCHSTNSCIN